MATLSLSQIVKPQPATSAPGGVRDALEKRFQSAKALRDPFEPDWQEIERLALPSRSQYLYTGAKPLSRRSNTSKQDTAARMAGRRMTNGMAAGFSNSALPWFELKFRDPELNEWQPVKEWLFDTQLKVYGLFAATNYYDAAKIAYSQLGHMGHAVTLSVEHRDYQAVWHPMETGEAWINQDDGLRTSTLFYRTNFIVEQLVRKFPWDRLSKAVQNLYAKNQRSALVPVMYCCERVVDRDESKLDGPNKPWRSTWYEEGNTDKSVVLQRSGFDSKPFTAPRWETIGAQVYSDTCPGFDALADMRELEFSARRRGRMLDKLARPPGYFPSGLQQMPISNDPGSINFINDMQSKPYFDTPDPNAFNAAVKDIERLERRVNELFYADLWMSISQMEGIQPKNEMELLYRNEEKLTQLGPVVDRVNIEKLEVDIDRAYTILDNTGQLLPAPKEIAGRNMEVDFVSILAQAQRSAANNGIERAARFVGFIGGTFPDALLKFDAEQAIDEFAANSNTSPKIIRSDEVVAKMKEQLEQQKQAEAMQQAAPAARDGAQAAELLSRTRVGPLAEDTSMLDQLLGQ